MFSACAGCQKPSALLTNTSSCHFCRRPFQTGYTKKRRQCKHRASHFKVSAKRRGPEKLIETNQSSQPDGPPGDTNPAGAKAAGLSDYLHFARLIGQRPAEAAKALSSNQIKYEVDAAAENYLERWQADEEPTYSTFEAMLGQGAGSSKLQKAKGRVPVNDDYVQFAKEAVANAQKVKQKDGRAIRSLLKAKAPGPAPGLARPPRLPPGSGGASTAKPSRQDQPTLMSRPKPPATDENRWLETSSDAEAESTGLDTNTPNLPPPALSYADFDLLIGNFKKKRKKPKNSPPQEKPAAPLQAQRPSRTAAVAPDSPAVPAAPAVRPLSEVPAPPSLEAKPSTWISTQPKAPKAFRPATPAAAQAPEVSLLAPPRGFQDKRASKSAKKSEDNPAPSLVARPVAPPTPPVAVQDRTGQQATSADASTRRSEATSSEANKGTPYGSVAAPGNGSEGSVQAAATATSSLNGLPAVVAPPPPRLPSSVPAMQRPKPPTSPSLASATRPAPMPTVQRPQQSSSSSSMPDNVAEIASQEAAVAKDAEAKFGFEGFPKPDLVPESPSEPSLAAGSPSELSLAPGSLQKPTRPDMAPNGQPASAQPASDGRAIDRSQAQVRAGSKQLAARRNQDGAQHTGSRSVAEPASRPSATGASRQKVDLSSRPSAEAALHQTMELSSRPDRSGARVKQKLPSAQGPSEQPDTPRPPKQPSKPSVVLAERPSMPPPSSSESSEVKFAHRFGKMMTLESSVLSLTESLNFAQRLKDEERQLPVVVVAANAGGVLVTNRMFKAFMPLQEMTSVMGYQVLSVDAELRKAAGVEGEIDRSLAGSIRRKAMRTLRGSTTTAKVIAVDMTARGSNVGIIMSCKQNVAGRSQREEHVYQELPQEHIDILQQNLGTIVQGTVVGVRPYGVFVAFDVEAASGSVLEVYGMVHLSEIAWDFCKDARLAVKQGVVIEAKLLSIDPSSCKVWLSMRQVQPDPLQETLDSLLSGDLSTLSDTDSTPQILGESISGDELAEGEMGFPEAEEVARSLALLLDVDSVQPGRFGTADPPVPDLQVYLAKPDLQDTVPAAAAAAPDDDSEEYDESDSDSESDDAEGTDSDEGDDHDDDNDYKAGSDSTERAVAAPAQGIAETLAEDPSVESLAGADDSLKERSSTATSTDNGHAVLMQAVGIGSGRTISQADAPPDSSSITPSAEVLNDESSLSEGTSTDALPEEATRLDATAGGEDDDDVDVDELSALFGWVDDCDSTVCTLVVQKGQHQQELLVSGGITRQQLTHEVDSIVASLNAAQDDGLANSS